VPFWNFEHENFNFGRCDRFRRSCSASGGPVQPVQCFLSVNGKIYIDKICNGEFEKDGSFTLGVPQTKRDRYFVYVNSNNDGTMDGNWNGVEAESHAHEPLGTLKQSGACWTNEQARVCAWKLGERRD